jgi:lysophospholipase L1-like esterase
MRDECFHTHETTLQDSRMPLIRYLWTAPGVLINAMLVMLSVALAFFLGEWLVRTFAPQQLSVPLGATVDGIISQRPNIQGRYAVPGVFETTVTINSQGLRAEKEYVLEPPSGVTRIVMLGDSFTFGIGANYAETYPAKLEQLLAASFGANRFEVINAGVGGTGTGEQARQFDLWVKQFHPRIVVLTAISNDVDDDLDRGLFVLYSGGDVRPRSPEELAAEDRHARTIRDITNLLPGYSLLSQHSHLLSLARSAINATIVAARRASASRAIPFPQKQNLLERYRSYGLPLLAGEVLWLQQKVRDSGARLVVVFVPEREAVYASLAPWAEGVRWKTSVISELLRRVCTEHQIPFLDLTSRLREFASVAPQPLYYEDRDTHPAPAGYQAIAEEVANFLRAQDDV